MAIELHVLADARTLETFRLARGMHLLGSTLDADLLLSKRDADGDICRVELTEEGKVRIRVLEPASERAGATEAGDEEALDRTLRRPDGTADLEATIVNGESVTIGRLRLLVLDRVSAPRMRTAGPAPEIAETAPSEAVVHPTRQRLALRIRSGSEVRVVPVDRAATTFGRGPDNTVSFPDLEVSRSHARLFEKPDGPWIEDLGSSHGTYLDGVAVIAAAWRLGSQVRLSRAPDAPTLELMTLADALAEPGDDDAAVAPLRGRSEAMRRVRAQILRYGPVDSPLLVLGETGTGKELVARALGRVRGEHRPFQGLNCGGLQESIVESELFGHCKGAFTGAMQDRAGQLEAASDGTLLLDEIGDMPLGQQVKLLRVLETREIQRVGDSRTRPFKARVVAATHRDLGEMVTAGQFREDLFHRLAVLEIRLSPLRERLEDLPGLARSMLAARAGQSAGKTLSDAAMDKLLDHSWPGNVRELRGVVERAALETDGPEIGAEGIEFRGTASTGAGAAGGAGAVRRPRATLENLPAHLDGIREDWCRRALAESNGNVRAAARMLGLSRTTLQGYLERFHIDAEAGEPAEPDA